MLGTGFKGPCFVASGSDRAETLGACFWGVSPILSCFDEAGGPGAGFRGTCFVSPLLACFDEAGGPGGGFSGACFLSPVLTAGGLGAGFSGVILVITAVLAGCNGADGFRGPFLVATIFPATSEVLFSGFRGACGACLISTGLTGSDLADVDTGLGGAGLMCLDLAVSLTSFTGSPTLLASVYGDIGGFLFSWACKWFLKWLRLFGEKQDERYGMED